jgi:hypothetical protein
MTTDLTTLRDVRNHDWPRQEDGCSVVVTIDDRAQPPCGDDVFVAQQG